jgi:hypothetical protein
MDKLQPVERASVDSMEQFAKVPLAATRSTGFESDDMGVIMKPEDIPAIQPVGGWERLRLKAVRREPLAEGRWLNIAARAIILEDKDVVVAQDERAVCSEHQRTGIRSRVKVVEVRTGLFQSSDKLTPLTPGTPPIDPFAIGHPGIEEIMGVKVTRSTDEETGAPLLG